MFKAPGRRPTTLHVVDDVGLGTWWERREQLCHVLLLLHLAEERGSTGLLLKQLDSFFFGGFAGKNCRQELERNMSKPNWGGQSHAATV